MKDIDMSRWRSVARQQRLLLQQCRGYAKEVTLLAGNLAEAARPQDPKFLRFATPRPQPYNHQAVLGLIPDTKVCWQIAECGALLGPLVKECVCTGVSDSLQKLSSFCYC